MIPYPSRSDIVTAMTNPQASFKAKELIGGSVTRSGSRVIQYSGGYTSVFPFHNKQAKKVAVRCWIADIGDAKKRSKEISVYLEKLNNSYFSGFRLVENALNVNGYLHPVIIMDWVNGLTLKEYINKYISNPAKIIEVAEKFREMVACFHQLNIAHGDLQHGNILITEEEAVSVIDYDSMYVLPLAGMRDIIKGLPGYQHPARTKNEFIHHKMDYFSELVIYLSLLIFAEQPSLWSNYYETEDLLFSKDDFANPYASHLIGSLFVQFDQTINRLAQKMMEELNKADLTQLRPLEELLIDDKKAALDKIRNKWDQQPNPPVKKPVPLPNKNSTIDKF